MQLSSFPYVQLLHQKPQPMDAAREAGCLLWYGLDLWLDMDKVSSNTDSFCLEHTILASVAFA